MSERFNDEVIGKLPLREDIQESDVLETIYAVLNSETTRIQRGKWHNTLNENDWRLNAGNWPHVAQIETTWMVLLNVKRDSAILYDGRVFYYRIKIQKESPWWIILLRLVHRRKESDYQQIGHSYLFQTLQLNALIYSRSFLFNVSRKDKYS